MRILTASIIAAAISLGTPAFVQAMAQLAEGGLNG